jgi:hypothetical protein
MKCTSPTKQRINGKDIIHKCGQCTACRITYRAAWKWRILNEMNEHKEHSFITLTYAQEHLPLGLDVDGAPIGVLDKNELTRFWQRLREATGTNFRYFACGEYGDKGDRPHYHAILYGISFTERDAIEEAWQTNVGTRKNPRYEPTGFVDTSYVTTARAGYVAKYTLKRLGESQQCIGSKPEEFAVMSRGGQTGGIGFNNISQICDALYLAARHTDRGILEVFNQDFKSISFGGKQYPIHPTLKDKIYKEIFNREVRTLPNGRKDSEQLDNFIYLEDLSQIEKERNISDSLRFSYTAEEVIARNDAKALAERKLRKQQYGKKL